MANRAAIYVRVSTVAQVQKMSLANQERSCRNYCDQNGLEVVKVFTEKGESARDIDRTQLKQLLAFITDRRNRISHLVVHDVDRLSRMTADFLELQRLVQGAGVKLHFVTWQVAEGPAGNFTLAMRAAMAQLENDVRGESTRSGMVAAVAQGRWTHRAPLGYLTGANDQSGPSLVPDPERADLVSQAFDLIANQRQSQASVCRRLNALGLRTLKGKEIDPRQVGRMLRNPVYAGRIEGGLGKAPGDFEPLVGQLLFNAVQRVLQRGRQTATRYQRDNSGFPLRRFVRCACCSTPLTGSRSTGRKGRRYAYYACREGCLNSTRTETLHDRFRDNLARVNCDPKVLDLLEAVIRDVWRQRTQSAATVRRELRKRLADIRRKEDRVDDAFIDRESIDAVTYARKKARVEAERRKILEELKQLEESLDPSSAVAGARKALVDPITFWNRADLASRQRFQELVYPEGLPFDGSEFRTAPISRIFWLLRDPQTHGQRMVSPTGFEPVSPA